LLAAAVVLPLALASAMAWTLRDPWPSPAEQAGISAQEVSFPSSSPFTPAQAGPSAEPTTAIGYLYLPRPPARGTAPPRSVPAVVLLHGAGGVLPAREHTYGRQLAAMGAAALVIDVFGSRRDRAAGFTERLLEITETMALADAFAGLRFLAQRPEIDPRRVVLLGFSYGAMASMYGVWATAAERLAPTGERFAGHAAFYGPCIARFEDLRTTGAPVLILYGDGDELILPERCAEFAADLRRGGSRAEVIVYPGALHQWDGGQPRRIMGRMIGACRLRVARDGTVRDERTRLPMTGPLLRRLILAACVEDRPYELGADDTVRARSNRDLGRFLDGVFRGPGAGNARGEARQPLSAKPG
jgi:dienelactone hydrolase